ncbi:MAG: type I-U CRISPR-associated protein Csb2 [Planctomycetaceae bacterium]
MVRSGYASPPPARWTICTDGINGSSHVSIGTIAGTVLQPRPASDQLSLISYRRETDVIARPSVLFHLQSPDPDHPFHYPQARLIHIAGMVRHLAIDALRRSPPRDVDSDWLETYVAGHAKSGSGFHRQFSYLPLPSIGNVHADQAIRRVLISAPIGDQGWLDHLARRLDGLVLRPTEQTKLSHPPILVFKRRDSVADCYTKPASTWTSVTPVILPGHDDHKPTKTRKLIEKSLVQSGVELPCEFEWSTYSRFRRSFTAHKYDRDRKPNGYIRPDHLLSSTAVHLTIRFQNNVVVPGPLVIGAGRHYGLGLMAHERSLT